MNETITNSWLHDLGNADPIVIGTLYLLVGLSIVTWFLIAYKAQQLWHLRRANANYNKWFWEHKDLSLMKNGSNPSLSSPLGKLTEVGLDSLKHHENYHFRAEGERGGVEVGILSESLTRSLRQAIQDQVTRLETGLGLLATIGNTAPFIGLFGTVIGIMSALKGISRTGAAGLDVVAGPIGEALIATATGIACAVPAVVGYNTFVRRLRIFGNMMENFAYDLLVRITSDHASRYAHAKEPRKELKI